MTHMKLPTTPFTRGNLRVYTAGVNTYPFQDEVSYWHYVQTLLRNDKTECFAAAHVKRIENKKFKTGTKKLYCFPKNADPVSAGL